MARKPRFTRQITALVTAEARAEIDEIAEELEATIGEVVREIVVLGLDARRAGWSGPPAKSA